MGGRLLFYPHYTLLHPAGSYYFCKSEDLSQAVHGVPPWVSPKKVTHFAWHFDTFWVHLHANLWRVVWVRQLGGNEEPEVFVVLHRWVTQADPGKGLRVPPNLPKSEASSNPPSMDPME